MFKDKVNRYFALSMLSYIVGCFWCYYSTPEQRILRATLAAPVFLFFWTLFCRASKLRSERRRKELIEVEKELDDTKEELRELASKLKTQVVVKGDKYHEVNAKIHWVAGKYGVILEGDVINPKKPQAP